MDDFDQVSPHVHEWDPQLDAVQRNSVAAIAKLLKNRAPILAGVGLVAAAASWLGSGNGSPRHAVELARALSDASGAVVDANDVRWEPSGGVIGDLVSGRFAIFLASDAPNAPRDVWRARVRLSPEGHPIDVTGAHNLTSTPLGDD